MFSLYYQDELQYLREMGRRFAEANPALAPMLADRGADPDVERLLEGVAFLTGRIREKLDDEVPEVIHSLANLLFPQLVRPVPGATILQLTPLQNALRELRRVPKGTEFDSLPVDGLSCRFRSIWDCEVSPMEISRASWEALPGGGAQIRLGVRTTNGMTFGAVALGRLRLHLGGDTRVAMRLRSLLLSAVSSVACRVGDKEVRLRPDAVRSVGFEDAESLLPWGADALTGFRLLEEYYILPSKFLFVDVLDFATAAREATELELLFRLDVAVGEAPALAGVFRLHCVPVVNLFATTAEPVRLHRGRTVYPLRPAGLRPGQGEVYSINRIEGVGRATGVRKSLVPFFEFHLGGAQEEGRTYYGTHRQPSVLDDDAELMVTLGTDSGADPTESLDVLSSDILATNGRVASAVRVGELKVATSSSPAFVTFSNTISVSQPVPVPLGRELQWRAVAHMAMGLRSLGEVEVLRTAMSVYNLHASVDRQVARANELRAAAVESVSITPTERLFRGMPVRGVEVAVGVNESGFTGDGDLHLFGCVLDRLFADYVSINSFSAFKLIGKQSNLRYSWPPRSGSTTLL